MTDTDEPTTPADGTDTGASSVPAAPGVPSVSGPARRPSAGAQAASRARRIGGRPAPGPSPTPRPTPRSGAEPGKGATVTLTKRRRPARDTEADDTRPDDGADDGGTDTERLRRQIERLRWVPALVAGVVVAVLLVLCVWQSHGVWWGKSSGGDRSKLRQEVLAAAKPCVAAIVSYDYRKLPASEKAGRACITGSFKADYTKAMETTVKTLAPQTKTVQIFQVAKAGVERVSADGKQWVVLLYGQQQVTNSTTAKGTPRLDILNVEATLNKVGGKWLISSIH